MRTDTSNPLLTVYYDGSCPICRREIGAYRTLSGAHNVDWLDISASSETEIGSDLTREAAMKKFHIRCANGSLKSGAAAFAELWAHLPALSWLARCLRLPGVRPATDGLYQIFLRLRPLLQKLVRS